MNLLTLKSGFCPFTNGTRQSDWSWIVCPFFTLVVVHSAAWTLVAGRSYEIHPNFTKWHEYHRSTSKSNVSRLELVILPSLELDESRWLVRKHKLIWSIRSCLIMRIIWREWITLTTVLVSFSLCCSTELMWALCRTCSNTYSVVSPSHQRIIRWVPLPLFSRGFKKKIQESRKHLAWKWRVYSFIRTEIIARFDLKIIFYT